MRTYYLFRSENDPQLQAFTDDAAGSKLPAGEWTLDHGTPGVRG